MKYFVSTLVFVCSIFFGYYAFGNTPPVANAYDHEILIGEQVQIDLSILAPEEGYVLWPALENELADHIELVSQLPIDTFLVDTLGKQGVKLLRQSVFVTSWDSGLWVIPPFEFNIGEDKLETEPIMLAVQNLEITAESELKDIKDIYLFPVTWREILMKILQFLPYIWGGGVLLAILAYIIGKSPKKKKAEPEIVILPHEKALSLLNQLRTDRPWENSQIKEFHVAISEITRGYLQHRFVVPALESTTDEIEVLLKRINEVPNEMKLNFIQALRISDMAKFAKVEPREQDNLFCLETAFKLVNETLPSLNEEVVKAEEKQEGEA